MAFLTHNPLQSVPIPLSGTTRLLLAALNPLKSDLAVEFAEEEGADA
jgi:hypothetical protein